MSKAQHTTPQLRFPEFSGSWEKKKLGDVFTFKVTNSFSRENLNYDSGEVKNIHYGDIHTKFPTLFDITKCEVPFINFETPIQRINTENYCLEGDLIFADASEDINDVGKSMEIINLDGQKLLSGLHTLLARPKEGVFGIGFKGYLFKSNNVRLQIQKESQGSKVLSINTGRLSSIDLQFPSLPEQTKIASFLTAVDDKLQALKKKKEALERYKKGMMQKLFAQEIRFKDDNGNEFPKWEKKKLGEVCTKQSSNISANKIEDNIGEYLLYGASGVIKKIDFYQVDNDYISIVKDGAGVGRLLYCNGKSSVLGTLDIIIPNSITNTYFLYCLLSNIDFTKYTTGSTIPHIYFKDYKKESIELPSLPEQTKIANFLYALDDKINQVEKQVQGMEQWKKGLLQKLFV
jgi:type I restriction enzyme, S subunit